MLISTNRLSGAEPLLRRALEITEHSYGPDHPDVAAHLHNLAGLLRFTSRLSEAEPLLRRALAIAERSHGPGHPDVATDLNNLAVWLVFTNRLREAEPLYRRALAIAERSYGPDHPAVAIRLNNLAELLRSTNRLSEAEPLYRRALAIWERSYGPDHPDVATDLNNLALLLGSTKRLREAEPLAARVVRIFARFRRSTGHEHPYFRRATANYNQLLSRLEFAEPEIAARIKAATEGPDRLAPIVPDVDRLLGPARPVADVLASLDRQYKEQGKPAVYFLKPNEPIVPHLDQLIRPNGDIVNGQGVLAFRRGAHAEAVVLYEAALVLMTDQTAEPLARLTVRMNHAAALRELGLVTAARDELSRLLPELEKLSDTAALAKGRARYHLAICQWLLGDRAAALRMAEESLTAYSRASTAKPIDPDIRRPSEDLLSDLKSGKAPPPVDTKGAPAKLESARKRYRARDALTKLPLTEKTAPLLDRLLGPAMPTKDVLEALDRQYREERKPAVWFLPLNEPIAPHLDELLGKPSR